MVLGVCVFGVFSGGAVFFCFCFFVFLKAKQQLHIF